MYYYGFFHEKPHIITFPVAKMPSRRLWMLANSRAPCSVPTEVPVSASAARASLFFRHFGSELAYIISDEEADSGSSIIWISLEYIQSQVLSLP